MIIITLKDDYCWVHKLQFSLSWHNWRAKVGNFINQNPGVYMESRKMVLKNLFFNKKNWGNNGETDTENRLMDMVRREERVRGMGRVTWKLTFSLVTQSCPTLCDPMNCSTPGLPVHHQLPEFTQTHVYLVGDTIQPSHPLSSPSSPTFNPSQQQGLFQWVSSSHQVAKVLEFQLQHQSFQWTHKTDL